MNEPKGPSHADPDRYIELASFEGDWREHWWNHDYLDLVARRLGLSEVGTVLDVGCGAGHWGRTLFRHLPADAKMTGVDREGAFLEMARTTAHERGLADRCTYQVAKGETLPFEDDTFDVATCQTVLIHVPDVPAVVREMARVVRPGGWVIAAEPDNLATTLSFLNTHPPTPDEEIVDLIRFQQICHNGKTKLGEGDDRIGAQLPGIFGAVGLTDVRAYNNDKCAWLVPPYATHEEQIDLAEHVKFAAEGAWFTGTREDSRRLYDAAGGDPERFDDYWGMTQRWWERFSAGTQAKTFHAGRGMLHYLVAGRVPG